jgi:hypothetical protein
MPETPVKLELLTGPEELELIRTLPGRARAHRSTVMRARREDPKHPAHQHPDGTFTDPRTTSTVEGLTVVVRAPKDAILTFWGPRKRGPLPRPATPAQTQEQS